MASEKSVNKEAEFSKGDLVTFDCYGKMIDAKVIDFQVGFLFDRVNYYYCLSGVTRSLNTNTTGVNVLESKLYKPYPKEK